jgi:hypothetical protein
MRKRIQKIKHSFSENFLYRLNIFMVIVCAFLMINPFTYLIMLGLYIPMAIPLWFQKISLKEKILWSVVPMSIPTIIYLMFIFGNFFVY